MEAKEQIQNPEIVRWLYNLMIEWGISEKWAAYVELLINIAILVVVLLLATWLIRKTVNYLIAKSDKIKQTTFIGFLSKNKFPKYLSLFVPYIGIKNFVPIIFYQFPSWIKLLDKIIYLWLVYFLIQICISLIKSGFDLLTQRPEYKDKPTKSYLQVITTVLVIIGIMISISILTGKSVGVLLTSLAAGSAIFMLIFQDSIKGFVASVLVTTNDMIRIGDWITMPKYNADGDVIEVNLTTVKVRNFDKTITTIPTYAMVSDSFQNWRGMSDAGGRRIKRAIILKQSSIRYISDDELPRFKKIQGISDYIDQRQKEIQEHNTRIGADRSVAVNGRNLTNGGLYRQYIEWYLHHHPDTHKGYTIMVRQLAPMPEGLPLEIYVFTNTTQWIKYENIMSDIFDHLIAAVKYFDLQIFEIEAGNDIKKYEEIKI